MRIPAYSGCDSCADTSRTPAPRGNAPASRSQSSQQLPQQNRTASAARSASTTTELTLTTAEGDKVTLSLSRGSLDAAATVRGDGQSSYASVRSRTDEVRIQVEGNLNRQEIEDITKLARFVSKAAGDLARGDDGRAARRVDRASQLGTIQSFAFSLNRQSASWFNYQSAAASPPAADASQ